jgi:hypothetical protein
MMIHSILFASYRTPRAENGSNHTADHRRASAASAGRNHTPTPLTSLARTLRTLTSTMATWRSIRELMDLVGGDLCRRGGRLRFRGGESRRIDVMSEKLSVPFSMRLPASCGRAAR